MRRTKKGPRVAPELVQRIDVALRNVNSAQLVLEATITSHAPRNLRRAADTDLQRSFDVADVCLREATNVARERSYYDWTHWRKQLCDLDTRRQIHLLAELDAWSTLRNNSVRAIETDTGVLTIAVPR